MCYDGKCLHCIQVETGTLIWAIISTGSSGLSLILSFGSFIYFNIAMSSVIAETQSDLEQRVSYVYTGVSNLVLLVLTSFSGLAFLFSMFLLMGVIKKHSGYVQAYFIYGVVKSILFSLTIITISCHYPFILILGIGVVLYSLILTMVRMTYVKFSETSVIQQYSHKILA